MVSENSGNPGRVRASDSWLVKAAVASVLAASMTPSLYAQDAAASAEEVGEVVVTGSRITRRDNTADSPIVTLTSEALQNTSEIGVEQSLNKMPQFVPGQNQFSDAGSITVTPRASPGIATANLRGLGANRTLVLLDGRRSQPANASMVIDLNTIPSAAIDNVEVITGGAGSTYGADAVSGVVNFKLKRNFQGLTVDAQTGMTERGDGEQTSISTLLGSNFDEGRGNFMIGLSFARREEVIREDVPFFEAALSDPQLGAAQFLNFPGFSAGIPGNVTNSPSGGAPSQAAVNQVFGAKGYPAGDVLSTGAFYFNQAPTTAGASLYTVNQGRVSGRLAPGYLGGTYPDAKYVVSNALTGARTLTSNNTGGTLQVPLTRYSLFTNARYELSDHVEVYMQARFDENQTSTRLGDYVPAGNQWGVTIPYGSTVYAPSLGTGGVTNPAYRAGGAYGLNCPATGGCLTSQVFPVPAEFATLLNSRAVTAASPQGPNANWTHNYNLMFMPKRGLENTQQTYELLAGLRGKLGFRDWTYDFFAARGNTTVTTEYIGFVDAASYQALISLPNYGRGQDFNNGRLGILAHCTSGLNPFLNTPVSQDCIDIIDSNAKLSSQLEQMQAELNIQGGLFEIASGEVRFAAGMDYRETTYQYLPDHGMQTTNIISVISGQFDTTETRGSIAVKEIYGEVLVPVLKDVPFVQKLELNGGFRYSEYDTNTGSDQTWKLTANWDMNDYVKVRGGRQVANRAPNIAELFSPAVYEVVTWTDHDPCSNLTRAPFGNVATNPNQARVNTLCGQLPGVNGQPNGFVYTPAFVGQNAVYFNAGRDLTQGNLALQSEEATTWTAGVVFRSPFESDALRNLTLSVDWYNIKIDGAIATTTTSYVYQECFNAFGTNPNYDPANPFCQRIVRDGLNGNWLATQASYANLSKVETSGVDSTLDYRIMTPFLGGRTGTLSLTVNASWLLDYDVQVAPNLPAFSYKDSIGDARYGAQYKYKTMTNVGYAVGPASVNLSWRHLPRVRHNSLVTNPASTNVPTSSYELFGLTGRFSVNDTWSVRGGVDNLLDRQPVRVGANFIPTATGSGVNSASGTTDTSNYDIVGRRYYLGVTARF